MLLLLLLLQLLQKLLFLVCMLVVLLVCAFWCCGTEIHIAEAASVQQVNGCPSLQPEPKATSRPRGVQRPPQEG